MKKLTLLSLLLAFVVSFAGFAQDVKFDAQKAELKWKGKKVTGEHWGYIALKSGTLNLKDEKITGGKFVIDMNAITCKDLEPGEWNDKLVGHLKNDDFFGVDKFPEAILSITRSGSFINNEATVEANLTLKGISQPITFKAIKSANGYTAQIAVNRTKYGIKYSSGSFFEGLGDKMIADEFILDVKLVK
jgi:polyisoprenoid-binding protein YceI